MNQCFYYVVISIERNNPKQKYVFFFKIDLELLGKIRINTDYLIFPLTY